MIESNIIIVSLVFFVLSFVVMGFTIKHEHGFSNKVVGRLIIGVGFSLFPLYLLGNTGAVGGPFDMTISSYLGIVRVLTGENSLENTREAIGDLPHNVEFFIANYTALLHFMLSLLVLGFVLNFFKNFLSKFSYNSIENGTLCVFNELSERTLLLAEDIRKREKNKTLQNCTVVFLAKADEQNSQSVGYLERLRATGAHIFDIAPDKFKIHRRYYRKNIDFFLLKYSEEENLKDALALAKKYSVQKKQNVLQKLTSNFSSSIASFFSKCADKLNALFCKIFNLPHKRKKEKKKAHFQIHILTSTPEAVAAVDTIEYSKNISLRLFDESRAMIYGLLDAHPLFLARRGSKTKIMVVGAGRMGTQAVKTCAWCAQTIDAAPEIIVIDSDSTWETRFAADCPELSPLTQTAFAKEESIITFYNHNVEHSGFLDIMKKHDDVGYIICALGNEELNLRTALYIRGAYEEIRFEAGLNDNTLDRPQIHLLLSNPFLHDISSTLKYNAKIPSDLKPFGNLKNLYTWENVVNPYLDHLGMAANRYYARHFAGNVSAKEMKAIEESADKDYEDREYVRLSSMATGLHAKYKFHDALAQISGIKYSEEQWRGKPCTDMIKKMRNLLLDENLVEQLSIVEHKRWNVYMRAQGWRRASYEMADKWYNDKRANKHRNFCCKLTLCLAPWKELDDVDNWQMEKEGKCDGFKELDRIMVRDLATIIEQAKELNGCVD